MSDIKLLDIYAPHNSEFAHMIEHKEGCKKYNTAATEEYPSEEFAVIVLSSQQYRDVQRLQQVQKLNGKTSGFDDLVEVLLTEGIKAKTRSEEYTYTSRARKQLDEGESKLHTQMQQGKLTPHQYADALEELRKKLRLGGSGIVL